MIDFNPHSREGSDVPQCSHTLFFRCISIHTPAKGVTGWKQFCGETTNISIHTPAKGVTFCNTFSQFFHLISIHTPAKGVTRKNLERLVPGYISIHTPAKGVTRMYSDSGSGDGNFNPHSREGSDYILIRYTLSSSRFQSTLPRRE